MSRGEHLREQLFLFEFLLEKLCIPACLEEKQPRLRMKFADFPCIELQAVGRGKRSLFSMAPLELACRLDTRPLALSLVLPGARAPIAAGRVSLQTLSDAARNAASTKSALPDVAIFRHEAVMRPTGRARLLLRLSCLGPAVVTQFQLSGRPERALFRGSPPDWRSVCPSTGEGAPPLTRFPLRPLLSSSVGQEPSLGSLRDAHPADVAAVCECMLLREAPTPKPSKERLGPDVPRIPLVQTAAPRALHPHVSCDTTGALSPAFQGAGLSAPALQLHPRVRYDGTGRLSAWFQGVSPPPLPRRLRVRYDTTSRLSPAYQRPLPSPTILSLPPLLFQDAPAPTLQLHPPVRYDTTGRLSPWCLDRVPVRYDTTGVLSPAFQAATSDPPAYHQPPPPQDVDEEQEDEEDEPAVHVWPPVRYDGTGLLSAAYIPPEPEEEEGTEAAAYGPTTTTPASPAPPPREQPRGVIAESSPPSPPGGGDAPEPGRQQPPGLEQKAPPKKRSRRRPSGDAEQPEASPTPTAPSPPKSPAAPADEVSEKDQRLQLEPADDEAAVELLKRVSERRRTGARRRVRRGRRPVPRRRLRPEQLAELQYPTVRSGHRDCVEERPHVPGHMGWLWNLMDLGDNLRARPNWKPGSVTPAVSRVLRLHSATPQPTHSATTRVHRRGLQTPASDLGPCGPTLVLARKGRLYTVSVKPARGEAHEPLQIALPRPSSSESSDFTLDTSTSSGLEVEFVAPSNFPPPRGPPLLRSRETQCYEQGAETAKGGGSSSGRRTSKKKKSSAR